MQPRRVTIFSMLIMLALAIPACNFVASTPESTAMPATAVPPTTVIVEPTSYPPPNKVPLSEAEVPRVPPEVALTALQSGTVVIVDVRSPEAYQASHIAGAISIPLGEIESNPNGLKLAKDQWIITYCT